ncbi:MAG TPA: thrombospondin type 3 repeat-containing protein, partial [Vicinamibacterales bacterium]|nr:thrombospondin type 3 repeat-containing protein [Vicinamibacterales bacterium]
MTYGQSTEAQAPARPRYRIIDLGTLGGTFSRAYALNNKGQVVGESLTAANLDVYPFVWTGGTMRAIPGLAGNASASGRLEGINNNGKAVGTWDSGAAGDLGSLFVYDIVSGALSFPLGFGSSFGRNINDGGQILAGRFPPGGGIIADVILTGSGVIDLNALYGAQFQGEEINAMGHVIGVPGGPTATPDSLIYANGRFTSIFGPIGFIGVAFNDDPSRPAGGFVREQTQFFGIRSRAAARRANGTYQNFGSFNVGADAIVVALNNLGQMVGNERGSGIRLPFIIENGSMRPLSSLLPPNSGWTLLEANDINDRGEIVGMGRINGEDHAYLLTPLTCSSAEDSDGDGDADDDGDGLCDTWETRGVDGDEDGNVDILLNSNPERKDLFVEIDYMVEFVNNPHGHRPRAQALVDVRDAFANAMVVNPDLSFGVTLHLDVDELVPEIETIQFTSNGPGVMDDFNDIKRGNPAGACTGFFGTAAERADPNCEAILKAREMVVRYAVFGHNHTSIGSSGIAESGANDFMVTLGDFDDDMFRANGGSPDLDEARVVVEAGTFMHEFGHTLGLRHGGADHLNCKPNYLSVMNYSFQFRDLVVSRPLDYSFPQLPTLDETQLDETVAFGIGGSHTTVFGAPPDGTPTLGDTSLPIDWNADGAADSAVSADINYIPDGGCSRSEMTFLTGFDDWSNIQYNFRHSPDFADGSFRGTVGNEPERTGPQGLLAAQSFDFDGDGVTNFPDNCPAIPNPTQLDTNGNGVGDACDTSTPADTQPPVTTATLTPEPNAAGWLSIQQAQVALNAIDDTSGVREIVYRLTGATVLASTAIPGTAAMVPIVAEGETIVRYFAVDNAG